MVNEIDDLKSGWSLYLIGLLQVVAFWGVAPFWLACFVLSTLVLVRFVAVVKYRSIKFIVVGAGLSWFFLYYRFDLTVEMAASFLWLALVFKLLEVKSARDVLVYVYTMFYLSAVSLLFNQSLLQALLQLALVCLGLGLLLRLNGGSARAMRAQWGALLKVLAFAIPLVVILFLFFPRLSPLWTIPIKAKEGVTGMTDTISPGDIAKLANSDERVFRARFSGDIPQQDRLYWRGLVLDQFDGTTWQRSPSMAQFRARGRYDLGRQLDSDGDYYEVLMEPHNQTWVFALEGSESLSTHLLPMDMGLHELGVEAIQPVRYRMSHEVTGTVYDRVPTASRLHNVERVRTPPLNDLFATKSSNPQTQAYIRVLREQFISDEALVAHLMSEFTNKPFAYTLEPPRYGKDFVDGFMFGERRGFCAHFASSLAYMLRLAGIPSRLVAGYQGGERINNGEYLLVRQYDAHAWVEAKVSGLGWVRLDPTAMVAPDRIESNLERAVSAEGSFLADNPAALLRNNIGLLSWMALKADELNYQWQSLVVNYSSGDQYSLFEDLFGTFSWAKLGSVLVAPFVLISLLVAVVYWLYSDRPLRSRPQKRYMRWLSLMSMAGFQRQVGETPRSYLERVSAEAPEFLVQRTAKETTRIERDEFNSANIDPERL